MSYARNSVTIENSLRSLSYSYLLTTVSWPRRRRRAVGERPSPGSRSCSGGGAARGFAHVGVIRVLEQEKIPIDMVVGTSVGSLIGAIYAS